MLTEEKAATVTGKITSGFSVVPMPPPSVTVAAGTFYVFIVASHG
jgi:hypothetical protein